MLLLTRRIGESIVINNNITVQILGIKGNQVRLGATAPREILIDREEIKRRRDKEKDNLLKDLLEDDK